MRFAKCFAKFSYIWVNWAVFLSAVKNMETCSSDFKYDFCRYPHEYEIQHLLKKLQFSEGWYSEFVTRKTCSGSFYIWVADVSFQITIYTRYTTNFWYPRINNNVVKTFAVSVKKLSDTQAFSLIFRAKVAFFLSRKNQLWKCFWKVI